MKDNAVPRHVFYGLNIFIPLLFGAFLYLTLRSDSFLSVFINRYIAFPSFSYSAFPRWLITFLRNFACDILWAYSLSFAVMHILDYCRKNLRHAFILCVCFICLVEAFQKAGIFHGTFDYLDILLEVCSVFIALQLIKKYEEANNEKSSENP